jgi:dimethylglycine catabolism A
MWKPPERIPHKPQGGPWPSAQEAEASLLFRPLSRGPLHLDQRTWVPAMVPWRATQDGEVTDAVVDWYARFAKGRPGAIVVEATGIRDIPSGPLLRISDDRYVAGLRRVVDAVRTASGGQTRLFIQLIDFLSIRRRPEPQTFFGRHLRITPALMAALGVADEAAARAALLALPVAEAEAHLDDRDRESLRMGYRERVTDVHLPHIRDLPLVLPDLFADAAARAKAAGFDGVELHYAHAYTMASFLSARNDRADGYGGAREGRVRLPIAVYRAVRGRVGPEFVVGCRYLADECIAGGNGVEDAAWFGTRFAEAGMDFLSLSRGGKFDDASQPKVGWAAYPYTGPSGYECMPQHLSDTQGPFGRNVPATAAIRAAVRAAGFDTPVVVAGGLHGFGQALGLLDDGSADIVALARQSLADPDWFLKVRLGRGAEVRLCEYTNYCEGLDQKHKTVTCKLWDREALDAPDATLDTDGKRRLTAPSWVP